MECVYRLVGLSAMFYKAMLTQANTIFKKVYQFHQGFFYKSKRNV